MGTTIALPQVDIVYPHTTGLPVFLTAGGRRPDPVWLRKAAGDYPVYAVDRGADHLKKAGILPSFLYGDRDSARPGAWDEFVRKGAKAKTYPVNKDDTDLALVVQDLEPHLTVIVSGVWGGRADHLLGNLFTLLPYAKKGGIVILADEQEVLCFLGEGEQLSWQVAKKLPQAVSLLPFTETAKVSISGVRWPLQEAVLRQEQFSYSISNKMTEPVLSVSCTSGWVGIYGTWKE